ncbi:DNA-binding protein [Ornithinibacillus caprae]|uniref:DNA-binding protein n=1 Tax=Ornithinibacillus caprae TaxID=2678566 RepID=UPI0018C6D0FE|nr:DNA-binding protein [Ornithinibacillus caprae]
MNEPNMKEVIAKLEKVLSGELNREEVSEWAEFYVMADKPNVDDENVWEMLQTISGIDILDSPTTYLYNQEDIKQWIEKAKGCVSTRGIVMKYLSYYIRNFPYRAR